MSVSINNSSQLASLLNKNKRVDFAFQFSEISSEENQIWSEKIRRNYFACGCESGKNYLLFSLLIVSCFFLFDFYFQKEQITLTAGFISIIFIFLMAGIGKSIGLLKADKILKKDIKKLKIYLDSISIVNIQSSK